MERHQTIAAHDPDQLCLAAALFEQFHKINRVAQVQLFLDVADAELAMMTGQVPDGLKPGGVIARGFFQGIAGCRKPPDLIQAQTFHRRLCDMQMSAMRRIETAAEQTNARPRAARRQGGGGA